MRAAGGLRHAPKPANDYTLKFTPDGAATIGGGGVVTDVWAVAQSRFTVALSNIPLEACGIAGGTTAGDNPFFGSGTATCQNIPLWKLNSLDWIVGGSDYKIMGMDLTFFYMVTHANDPIDPYTPAGAPGGATNPLTSIKLPNTTVTVTTP